VRFEAGFCCAQGERLVEAGKVRVNGAIVRSQSVRVRPERDVIEVDGTRVAHVAHVYVMLNKPRGLVTTTDDPQGRATVYESLRDPSLPFVAPVGRLDKASEGLLLLTNDSRWSARLLDPASHVDKVYHVQIRATDPESIVDRVARGIVEGVTGERLEVKSISLLRTGSRGGAWLEVVLDEGKNRQLRRISRRSRCRYSDRARSDRTTGARRSREGRVADAASGRGRCPRRNTVTNPQTLTAVRRRLQEAGNSTMPSSCSASSRRARASTARAISFWHPRADDANALAREFADLR
jgi:pseudouridine synthase